MPEEAEPPRRSFPGKRGPRPDGSSRRSPSAPPLRRRPPFTAYGTSGWTNSAAIISERIVGAALRISILLYLAVLVFEAVWGGLLPFSLRIGEAETYRTLSKLLLGSISAAALFISNYYGRLSLSRVTSDHVRMERFYRTVLERIDRYGETPGLLLLIAREELIENGSWCSYQRDNTADFNL